TRHRRQSRRPPVNPPHRRTLRSFSSGRTGERARGLPGPQLHRHGSHAMTDQLQVHEGTDSKWARAAAFGGLAALTAAASVAGAHVTMKPKNKAWYRALRK